MQQFSAYQKSISFGGAAHVWSMRSHSMSLHVTANHMKIDKRKGSWLFYTVRMILVSRKCMTNIRKLALLFKMAVLTSNCQGVSGSDSPLCLQGAGSLNDGGGDDEFLNRDTVSFQPCLLERTSGRRRHPP